MHSVKRCEFGSTTDSPGGRCGRGGVSSSGAPELFLQAGVRAHASSAPRVRQFGGHRLHRAPRTGARRARPAPQGRAPAAPLRGHAPAAPWCLARRDRGAAAPPQPADHDDLRQGRSGCLAASGIAVAGSVRDETACDKRFRTTWPCGAAWDSNSGMPAVGCRSLPTFSKPAAQHASRRSSHWSGRSKTQRFCLQRGRSGLAMSVASLAITLPPTREPRFRRRGCCRFARAERDPSCIRRYKSSACSVALWSCRRSMACAGGRITVCLVYSASPA